MKTPSKIIMAAGGTGGHLFPAQILADQLSEAEPRIECVFMGAHLTHNRYFRKESYAYYEVASATPIRRSLSATLKALWLLLQGVRKSFFLLRKERPDLVVGFGSFHSFPVLCAARLCRIPMILFEPNIHPGRVNRLFSAKALFTAVIFPRAGKHLKGQALPVAMPAQLRAGAKEVEFKTRDEKVGYFSLSPTLPIILVFGGSQGAAKINELWLESMGALDWPAFQVIHILGNKGDLQAVREQYAAKHIRACVKAFESHMVLAYEVAALAICRSGAATLAELIAFELPSIVVPFPHATEDHQTKNALFLTEEVGGARYLAEEGLSRDCFIKEVNALYPGSAASTKMKRDLKEYKQRYAHGELWEMIWKEISKLKN